MNTFQRSAFFILMVAFFNAVLASTVFGAPNLLNYQGRLLDDLDQPVSGTKTMKFEVYDVASGGVPLWASDNMQVQVEDGWFNVAIEGFSNDLFSGDSRYMAVVVEGEALAERKRLASVPYALNAGGIASSGGGDIPSGLIAMWSGSADQIPSGWALCDGSNGAPDLRDRFIVGVGNQYTVGSQGGSATNNLSHSHSVDSHTHHIDVKFKNCIYDCGDGADDGSKDVGSDDHGHHLIADTESTAPGTDAQLSAQVENRPPYFALCFIMKL